MSARESSPKTLREWEKHGGSWGDYCKPGELVEETVYWYFLDIMPPKSMRSGYLQVGEPYDGRLNPKTGKYASTYMTFTKVKDGLWRYCGNCFAGEVTETGFPVPVVNL